MAWIRVVEPQEARGTLKDVYEQTAGKRGKLAAIHKIHSLHPESLSAHMGLYMTLMFGRSPLSRREREALGVAVSRANGCAYCVAHHSDALRRYEKDEAVLAAVQNGAWERLNAREAALCRYGDKLTRRPAECSQADVKALHEAGFGDAEVLDAAQITGYFNFVNRLVLGLGVALEDAAGRQGYKYD
ncbi:MAG: peroxidase-related enzyme [Elusimicrobia bacterium]|nr:peroxidase-related enzyme [Elusimicrobiota bacterium]